MVNYTGSIRPTTWDSSVDADGGCTKKLLLGQLDLRRSAFLGDDKHSNVDLAPLVIPSTQSMAFPQPCHPWNLGQTTMLRLYLSFTGSVNPRDDGCNGSGGHGDMFINVLL